MNTVMLVDITDDNRDTLLRLALSMYLGERCKYCNATFQTLDDLKDAVWAGYHDGGRLAHESCFKAAQP